MIQPNLRLSRALASASALALLAGCAAIPKVDRQFHTRNAAELGLKSEVAAPVAADWWKAMGDPQLDRIVADALAGNPGLDEAAARERIAQALIGNFKAGLLPDLALNASTTIQFPQRETPMTKIIVVTSGKGGVGKTTTSASFSTGLAQRGFKTAVIDFDVGLRNLDLIMGCERRVVYDLINVINGEATLTQALIKDKHTDNLYVLPASQTRDKDALSEEGVEKVIKELEHQGFDYIVCDSPAGIESGAIMALTFADEALVVTNPEVSSVRDSDRILGILQAKSRRAIEGREPVKEHLLITRYNPTRVEAGEMLSYKDIQEILRVPIIGVIPESEDVLQASNQGAPVIHQKESDASLAYQDVIGRFLGEDKPLRFVDYVKPSLLKRLFGGK